MKKLFYLAAIAFCFSSCSKIIYSTTPKEEAKEMVNHHRTSTDVSHEFNDQIKQFMISAKAIKKISNSGDYVYYVLAAYTKDHPSGDAYRKKNMFTVLIYVADKENKTKEVVDIRDINVKRNNRYHADSISIMSKKPPICECPPPDCKIACIPD